ncbi:MAG TPA: hypothetical protein VKI20_07860 [Acidimicrobiales bacterium]|nr:hypothetical protein [Acidimicrobiales bacterium]
MHFLLAALHWDPQIRGYLIVLTALVLLPGSVYMLLATNMGAKLGLLLALAGLSGWIFIMSTVWAVFGIGLSGRLPSWKALEIDTGNISAITTQSVMAGFPRGWQQLPTDRPEVADATSSADRFLAPSTSGGTSRLATPFKNTTDYVTLGVWRRGGDNYLFKIHHHKFFLRHSPHYDVVEAQPVVQTSELPGSAPPKPVPDVSRPTTSVVMVRDLGSLRQPPIFMAIGFGLFFGVCCYQLHRRDKMVFAARVPATT